MTETWPTGDDVMSQKQYKSSLNSPALNCSRNTTAYFNALSKNSLQYIKCSRKNVIPYKASIDGAEEKLCLHYVSSRLYPACVGIVHSCKVNKIHINLAIYRTTC